MTTTIILGKRGSDYGLWISKAGFDAATAEGDELLYQMGDEVHQPLFSYVWTGRLNYNSYQDIAIPDFGFYPTVFWAMERWVPPFPPDPGYWYQEQHFPPTLVYIDRETLRFYSTYPSIAYNANDSRISIWLTSGKMDAFL